MSISKIHETISKDALNCSEKVVEISESIIKGDIETALEECIQLSVRLRKNTIHTLEALRDCTCMKCETKTKS